MLSVTKKILCFAFVMAPLWSHADSITGQIVDVHDGDTLTIQVPGDPVKYKVRMLGVDTPEVEFFKKTQGESAIIARDFLRQMAPVGATAMISYDSDGFDKHSRILGRIIVNGIEVNREMLKSGWGYYYFIAPFDKKIAAEYSELARQAAEGEQGLFSAKYIKTVQPPYEFRLTSRDQIGFNLVGDIDTKVLYQPADSNQVPVWRRVFFPDQKIAERNGYRFR